MYDKSGDFLEDKELSSSLKRYEAMNSDGKFLYFDVDEFISIINYYIDNELIQKANDAVKMP
jgi:hypothetical protein